MDINTHIERAEQLIETRRYDMALKELNIALSINPNSIEALDAIAGCYYDMGKYKEALAFAQKYVAAAPDSGRAYYLLSITKYQLDDKEAKPLIDKAIGIEPFNADFRGIKALFLIEEKQWEAALEAAQKGLELDPENAQCLNFRNLALTKMGRANELNDSIEEALASNPDDANTHATIGWTKLETRNYKEARHHFGEALRLEPHNEGAKAGMVEALKAKNIIYRGFLAYFFWIAKHKASAQWAIIIAIYVGMRILRGAAKTMPILYIPYGIIAFAAYLTWIIEPIFNIMVLLDPYGKYLLNEREKQGAILVGAGVVLAISFLIAFFISQVEVLLLPVLYFASVVIPVSSYFSLEDDDGNIKKVGTFTLSLVILGALAVLLVLLGINLGNILAVLYLLGVFAFGWVANYLATR